MRTRIAVVCVACLVCLGVVLRPAAAQYSEASPVVPKTSEQEEAIPVGPFLFSPAVQLSWEARDNIFYEPTDPTSDDIYLARARLMFELPIYDNYVRFTYQPKYRDFRTYDYRHHWSHDLGLTGAFEFPSGLKLNTDYRYFLGNLEVREVDPGGELMYGGEQFKKNYFHLGADYWFNPSNGLRLLGQYSDVTYENRRLGESTACPPAVVCQFYDYSELIGGIGWLHQVSATLVMNVAYNRRKFSPKDTLDYRDQSSDQLTVGFEGQITPLLSSTIQAGWRETRPDVQPGDPHVDKYSAPEVTGSLSYQLAHGSTLQLNMLYTDYPSDFGLNAFYTAKGASLLYDLQRDRLFGQARVRLQTNDYDLADPVSGHKRSDDVTTLGLGLGYRITDLISVAGGYVHEKRDTLHEYSYTANTFVLSVVIGYGFGY